MAGVVLLDSASPHQAELVKPFNAEYQIARRALAVTPGGVNSPVRAFRAVGGTPRFIRSGSGAWGRSLPSATAPTAT